MLKARPWTSLFRTTLKNCASRSYLGKGFVSSKGPKIKARSY